MMKKMLAYLLAALMLISCSAALAEDAGLANIMAKGKLVMGFDEAYPPMGFVDENGEHVGFDIDLAKEVAARMGVELVLQPISWDAKELELSGGNIDCIWSGLTITPERREQMLFTMPYLANEQIMVVMADSGIASVADTAGKVLGTQAGSASVDVLEANPDVKDALAEIALSDDFVAALMDLRLGGIDVLLIDSVVGNYYIAQQADPAAFAVLPEVLQAEEYGIAVRKGEQTLADAINAQLIAIAEDGTLDTIRAGWFANDVTTVAKYADEYKK
ncbi:MAG: amino acid ABC transporter substrate-binding protein [Clostridia bacterium]|nr:amino acid ABC transporter substrate-binding protein [Clostridia bacterium]MBQ7053020.1 amino acid ABC transporter substrate-binding protein [Clostridia bacterium]